MEETIARVNWVAALTLNSNSPGVAELVVHQDFDRTNPGRQSVGQPESNLHETNRRHHSHVFSRHIKSLAIIVNQIDSNDGVRLSRQQRKVRNENHDSRIWIEACVQHVAAVYHGKHIPHMQHGIQSGRLINSWTTGL